MKSAPEQIEDIKKNGYTLDFSKVFDHAFENYKKIALYAGLILLVFSVLFAIIFLVVVVGIFGLDNVSIVKYLKIKPQSLTTEGLIYYISGTAILSAFFSPFAAGFLKMADCADRDKEFNVSTIFTYYKSKHLSQILLATLVISFISITISTSLEIQNLNVVSLLTSTIISFFTFLTIPLIIFGNLKAFDAIKSSCIIISKQPLVIFALTISIAVALIVGVLAFIIGLLFTIPFLYSMTYTIYRSIINYEDEDLIETIGQSDSE